MFAWGKASDGQLGLGGIEEPLIPLPKWNKHVGNRRIKEIACGKNHTVILLEDGGVFSCGSNDVGQLGQDTSTTRPARITALDTVSVAHISCGYAHSVALTTKGQLLAWGSDNYGQLGLGTSTFAPKYSPRNVKALIMCSVVQVVCGGNHTMALLQDGRVYSWGHNMYGQLGGNAGEHFVSTPTEVSALEGLPMNHIAAGGGQSFAVSVSGAVYGWGRNNFGQLGIGHQKNSVDPTELTTLRSHKVRYIACGDEHTVVLTEDGGVFTFGSGSYGQLGHNSTNSITYPAKVFELMGSTVSQIACGRCHTLALIKPTGRIFSFGLGGNGQLGAATTANCKTPTPVCGEWLPSESVQEMGTPVDDMGTPVDVGYVVKRIYAGGDQSFAAVIISDNEEPDGPPDGVHDCRVVPLDHTPYFLTFESVKHMLDIALITKDNSEVVRTLEMAFTHPACLDGSFLASDHQDTSERYSGVDIASAQETFQLIRVRFRGTNVENKLQRSLQSNLLPALSTNPLSIECARLYYLLPTYVMQPPNLKIIVPFLKAFLLLDSRTKNVVGNWVFSSPREYLYLWLNTMKTAISEVLRRSKASNEVTTKNRIGDGRTQEGHSVQLDMDILEYGLQFLKCIHDWNGRHGDVILYNEFHLKAVSEVLELGDMISDYCNWMNHKPGVVFCRFPFVLDAQAKSVLMKVESRFHMELAVHNAQRQNIFSMLTQQTVQDSSPMAFELRVRRANLVNDTVRQLISTDGNNYKKPLLVTFIGEEGLDDGGVKKEFFMLLLQEILNPDFGMFVEDEESHLVWFREQAFLYESLDYFSLIGILCGLAIYNSVIMDLPFPSALYKKLLNRPIDLSDLKELHPSLGKNLQELLDYEDDDFEETFGLTFEITRSHFGAVEVINLAPGGSKVPVTKDTRGDYVVAYVKQKLTVAVKDPFDAFKTGFLRVCGGNVLDLFHPMELMILVVGSQVVDWTEMEKYTSYRNGYSPQHPSIRMFWKVFYELPTEAKKKFLVFLTGSNRIPIAGVKSMDILIQRMDGGPGCERLPVAHTCFNVLDLPPYRSEEQMKEKLLQAINFTAGFGIV